MQWYFALSMFTILNLEIPIRFHKSFFAKKYNYETPNGFEVHSDILYSFSYSLKSKQIAFRKCNVTLHIYSFRDVFGINHPMQGEALYPGQIVSPLAPSQRVSRLSIKH